MADIRDVEDCSVFFLVQKNANITPTITFLKRRDINVGSTSSIKDFLSTASKHQPDFVVISVNHTHPKLLKLADMMKNTFGSEVILFAETPDRRSLAQLQRRPDIPSVMGAITGPTLLLKMRQILREAAEREEARNQENLGVSQDNPEASDIAYQPSKKPSAPSYVKIQGEGSSPAGADGVREPRGQGPTIIQSDSRDSSLKAREDYGDITPDVRGRGLGPTKAREKEAPEDNLTQLEGRSRRRHPGEPTEDSSLQARSGRNDQDLSRPDSELEGRGGPRGQEPSGDAEFSMDTDLKRSLGFAQSDRKDDLIGFSDSFGQKPMVEPDSPESLEQKKREIQKDAASKNTETSFFSTPKPVAKKAKVDENELLELLDQFEDLPKKSAKELPPLPQEEDGPLDKTKSISLSERSRSGKNPEQSLVLSTSGEKFQELGNWLLESLKKSVEELEDPFTFLDSSISKVGVIRVKDGTTEGYVVFVCSDAEDLESEFLGKFHANLKGMKNHPNGPQWNSFRVLQTNTMDIEGWSRNLGDVEIRGKHKHSEILTSFVPSQKDIPVLPPSLKGMYKLSTEDLKPEVTICFDTFLHLKINQKVIKYVADGGFFTDAQLYKLSKRQSDALLIKEKDIPKFEEYYLKNNILLLKDDKKIKKAS